MRALRVDVLVDSALRGTPSSPTRVANATIQTHPTTLQPVESPMSDNAAVASLKDAGIAELYFVRHASSAPLHEGAATRADAPHDWKRDDQLRCLTAKGKDQCAAAAAGTSARHYSAASARPRRAGPRRPRSA